jgi:hypothetical protein
VLCGGWYRVSEVMGIAIPDDPSAFVAGWDDENVELVAPVSLRFIDLEVRLSGKDVLFESVSPIS